MDIGNSKSNEGKKVSRRTFLKTLTGTAAGVAVALTLPTIAKAENAVENINDRFILDNGITYIDSAGRRVVVAQNVQRVIPAGIFAQTILEMLCPEKLTAVAKAVAPSQQEFYAKAGLQYLSTLPETGEIYKSSNTNSRMSIARETEADLVIDIGNQKENQERILAGVQSSLSVPTIFIDGTVGNIPTALRVIGRMLGVQARAESLAIYLEQEIYSDIEEVRREIMRAPKVYYAEGVLGCNKKVGYSYQDEVFRYMGIEPVSIGAGAGAYEIDQTLIAETEIDYIIFGSPQCYEALEAFDENIYEIWKSAAAIQDGKYALSPGFLHDWVGSPALVQMIGMAWLAQLIVEPEYNLQLLTKIKEFSDLFYNYVMSDSEAEELAGMANI